MFQTGVEERFDTRPSVFVVNSKNIIFNNVKIINKHIATSLAYTDSKGKKSPYIISTALSSYKSNNIVVFKSELKSNGKGTFKAVDSTNQILDSSLFGYYFVITASRSTIISDKSVYSIRHLIEPKDIHSMFWTSLSNFYMSNNHFKFEGTGLGIFSGLNHADNELVIHKSTKISGTNVWLQKNLEYGNMHLKLYGDYPSNFKDFFLITWQPDNAHHKPYPASSITKNRGDYSLPKSVVAKVMGLGL